MSLIFLSLNKTFTIQDPGRLNPKYKIKNYYGSRYLSTFLSSTFYNDDPVIVEWSTGQFLTHLNKYLLYISDPNEHNIKIIKENVVNILMGEINTPSFRNGDAENARINQSSALVIYNATSFPNSQKYNPKYTPYLFKSNSLQCKYSTLSNYTSCLNTSFPKITNESIDIDRNLIKLINTNTNSDINEVKINYMFISDTGNHCIRKLDLLTAEVTTYAGLCKVKGFRDGPIGVNRFDTPKGIGVDSYGNVFVYDSGNRYMRMIDTSGFVHTLINGACFEYTMEDYVNNEYGFKNEKLLCFRKWIKNSGNPNQHIYVKESSDICYDNIVGCEGYSSDLSSHVNDDL